MTMTCQFPINDPRDPDFHFCGQPIERPGRSYCPVHTAIAYPRSRRPRPSVLHKSAPRPRGTGLAGVGSNLAEPVS
jgi:hypothetical protein